MLLPPRDGDEALAAWEKSLEINDRQPDSKKKVNIQKKRYQS
jgi:hypothetical protein